MSALSVCLPIGGSYQFREACKGEGAAAHAPAAVWHFVDLNPRSGANGGDAFDVHNHVGDLGDQFLLLLGGQGTSRDADLDEWQSDAARLAEHIVVTLAGGLLLARAQRSVKPLRNAAKTLTAVLGDARGPVDHPVG